MAKVVCLKLKEDIFEEVEKLVHKIHVSRNSYINNAIDFYNQFNKRRLLKKQLHMESSLVRQNSLVVLEEFEKLEDALFE